MARALRFDFPNTIHHVTNRGLECRDIVCDDEDRHEFVRLLGRVASRHAWQVFAWVLLDNHFHLFFRIPTASLSFGMHDFESGYATIFNRRHERSGPLFQGRFHDVVVENESHAWELSRYVHLNPCRARLVPRPELWHWSSYRYYLDPHGAPQWLDWPTVLVERSLNEAAARIAYKTFVEAGLSESPANPIASAVDGWIVGSDEFAQRIRTVCLNRDGRSEAHTSESIIETVAKRFETPAAVIRRRGRHGNMAREVALLLCRELLENPAAELAAIFEVAPSGFSMSVRRARERMESDSEFARIVMELRKQLQRE